MTSPGGREPARPPESPAATYELRVRGQLSPQWSDWFGQFTTRLMDDGTTVLTGAVTDQAELHGVLAKIRDLGLPLISVRPMGNG